MSIQLIINHVDGMHLRHQVAHQVQRIGDEKDSKGNVLPSQTGGEVKAGTEWIFEGDVPRDKDPRKLDTNGHPLILPTYTFHISYGLKNVVIEKKGKAETVNFRNSSLRNSVRIKSQVFVDTGKKDKGNQPIKAWVNSKTEYFPANTWCGVMVGDGMRSIVDEMPT